MGSDVRLVGRVRAPEAASRLTYPSDRSPRMAEPAVIVEKDGHVLTVTLNRPEKRNAVNCEVMCRLYDAWHQLDQDDELRAAILTGTGDTFCAGMDLSEIGKLMRGQPDNEWMERVMNDMPVIYGAW